MKMLMVTFAVALVLLFPSQAFARCTTSTIFMPDGRIMFCTTCCYGGSCTTTCL